MKESEIKKVIGETTETPSAGFTERVMVSVVNAAGEAEGVPGKRSYIALIAASVILTVASLFVRLPESVIYNLPVELNYLFIPVITIATLFIVAWHLYDTVGSKQTNIS